MSEIQTAEGKFPPVKSSASFRNLLDSIEHAQLYELIRMFDEWPLEELRDAILKRLKDRPFTVAYEEHASWAEQRITGLRQSSSLDDHSKGNSLFNWYLFNGEGIFATRALEFAVAVLKEDTIGNERIIANICGALSKNASYWEFPSIDWFLEYLFSRWGVWAACHENEYSEEQWLCVERAVRRVIEQQDVRHLPKVEAVYAELSNGDRQPDEFLARKQFEKGRHQRLLQDAISILRVEQERQFPDLNATLGAWLRRKAHLKGSVSVELFYPETSPLDGTFACIELRVSPTIASEAEKLAETLDSDLKGISVAWWAEGFDRVRYTKNQVVRDIAEHWIRSTCERNDIGWHICLHPTAGINRFTLIVGFGQQELVRVSGYIKVK